MNVDEVERAVIKSLDGIANNFQVSVIRAKDGDFGDLADIDFSDGSLMGHIALWSSGMIFYNLFDNSKSEDYVISKEDFFDATDLSSEECLGHLDPFFALIKDQNEAKAKRGGTCP